MGTRFNAGFALVVWPLVPWPVVSGCGYPGDASAARNQPWRGTGFGSGKASGPDQADRSMSRVQRTLTATRLFWGIIYCLAIPRCQRQLRSSLSAAQTIRWTWRRTRASQLHKPVRSKVAGNAGGVLVLRL
jgi:hypothetical protein